MPWSITCSFPPSDPAGSHPNDPRQPCGGRAGDESRGDAQAALVIDSTGLVAALAPAAELDQLMAIEAADRSPSGGHGGKTEASKVMPDPAGSPSACGPNSAPFGVPLTVVRRLYREREAALTCTNGLTVAPSRRLVLSQIQA
jgi:hypothetical protein